MSNAIRLMQAQNLTIEEVDTLTGTPLDARSSAAARRGPAAFFADKVNGNTQQQGDVT